MRTNTRSALCETAAFAEGRFRDPNEEHRPVPSPQTGPDGDALGTFGAACIRAVAAMRALAKRSERLEQSLADAEAEAQVLQTTIGAQVA